MTQKNYKNNSNDASSKAALDRMKTEVANELGIADYDNQDKGNMTSKQNGNVGGQMTKRLVELGQEQLRK